MEISSSFRADPKQTRMRRKNMGWTALSLEVEHPGRDKIAVLDGAEGDRRSEALDVSAPLCRAGAANDEFLAAPDDRGAGAIDGQGRDLGQPRLQRQNGAG